MKKKEVELFLMFYDNENRDNIELIKKLFSEIVPYYFWKEGDMMKLKGVAQNRYYGYSICSYMKKTNYESIEGSIDEMMLSFTPYIDEIKEIIENTSIEVTLTVHLEFSNYLPSFGVSKEAIMFLSEISADIGVEW